VGNQGGVETEPIATHGRPQSLALSLPPLGVLFLQREKDEKDAKDAKDLTDLTDETEDSIPGELAG
jgi:hypothetical protein